MIPDEKRLTPERVRKAYETTRLEPLAGDFIRFVRPPFARENTVPEACCGGTAAYLADSGSDFAVAVKLLIDQGIDRDTLAARLGVAGNYMGGFICGFDWDATSDPMDNPAEECFLDWDSEDFRLGFADGRESAQVVFKS
jgi:hypothetical protein